MDYVSVKVTHGNRTTQALAHAMIGGESFSVTGEAIRTTSDKQDATAGAKLATGRALQALGAKLERQGHGLVKHQDDVAADQKRRRPLEVAPADLKVGDIITGFKSSADQFAWHQWYTGKVLSVETTDSGYVGFLVEKPDGTASLTTLKPSRVLQVQRG